MAYSLNISTLNCRGLNDYSKRDFIINYLNSNYVDVCLLQGDKGREQTDECMIVEEEVEQIGGEAKKAWEAWDKEYDVMEETLWQNEKKTSRKSSTGGRGKG